MKIKYVLAAAMLAALVAPASAAEVYYVAQDAATKKCSVVETKPDGTTMIMVGDATYKTKDEAQEAMAGAEVCQQ